MTYDEWKLASPPEEKDDERRHRYSYGEQFAQAELVLTLQHWKDGTRPGDDIVTASDVMRAVAGLVYAMIEREHEDNEAREHAR